MRFAFLATAALLVSTASAAPAGGPIKDLNDLVKIVTKQSTVKWSDYRVVSFSGLEHPDDAKAATRFVVETLNRVSRKAPIALINDQMWAINVAQLGWPADAWDDMSKEWAYYASLDRVAKPQVDFLEKHLGTRFPVMRADVFVKQAWEPEWYVKLLRLPANRQALYDEFGIDPLKAKAVAVVADDLTVSKHPRKVAWVPMKNGGMAWVSMGYKNCRAENDSTKHPTNFGCDYNEIAVEMPNGLDMYYAADGKTGARLGGSAFNERDLPTEVVEDHTPTGPQVLLGMSCVSCHAAGVKPLGHAAEFAKLDFSNTNEPHSVLFDRYDREEAAEKSVDASERWVASLWRLTRRTPEQNQKAWRQVFADLDAPVTVTTAARELGVSEARFFEIAAQLDGSARSLASGQSISRSDWENSFGEALAFAR